MELLTIEEKTRRLNGFWRGAGYTISFGMIGFAWFVMYHMSFPADSPPLLVGTWVVVTVLVWLLTKPLRR